MTHMLWTTNVINDQEEKESFETYLQNNQRLLKRLGEILEEKENSLQDTEDRRSSYRNYGWAYEQAHINGARSILRELKQLTK